LQGTLFTPPDISLPMTAPPWPVLEVTFYVSQRWGRRMPQSCQSASRRLGYASTRIV